jgi:predicted aspartyl protease
MFAKRFWSFVLLTSLTVVGQSVMRAEDTGGSVPRSGGKVEFELYRDYLIIVRGSVGPLKGLNFLVDTGATPSVLDPRIKEKLNLTTIATQIAVLNGSVRGETAIIPSVQIGPIRRDNVTVSIQDLSFFQKALPIRIDGIVGLDVLGQDAFVVDYPSRQIRFGPLPAMPGSIPFHIEAGLAIVDAVVNHAQVHLLVDTGASSMILFDEMRETAHDSKAESATSSKTIGDFERSHSRSINLTLGKTKFDHEVAFVVQNHRDMGHNFDGLMSPAALGITRVAVDPGRGMLAFTREP